MNKLINEKINNITLKENSTSIILLCVEIHPLLGVPLVKMIVFFLHLLN